MPAERGFTLIEVLVALAVFSLAAMALMRLQGASLGTAARLEEKLVAQIVARNHAVEASVEQPLPAFGATIGSAENAGRSWAVARQVVRTPDPTLVRIDVEVRGAGGEVLARDTVLRPAA